MKSPAAILMGIGHWAAVTRLLAIMRRFPFAALCAMAAALGAMAWIDWGWVAAVTVAGAVFWGSNMERLNR